MTQYTITPWRTPSELLAVRTLLYNPSNSTDRHEAIKLIRAWKLRNNLPHAVESTGLLFSALEQHEVALSSNGSDLAADSFGTRAAYTLALSRFVTGFADLGRHRAGVGQTMQDVARSINLPPQFVELRHEAAHEEVPTLGRLVRMAEEAVAWLWQNYWALLDANVNGDGEHVGAIDEGARKDKARKDREEVRREATELLKCFKSKNLAALKKGGKAPLAKTEVSTTCEQCLELCGNSKRKWSEFSDVLIPMIIPSKVDKEDISKHMQGAKLLWDEWLRSLAATSSKFLTMFLETAVIELASPRMSEPQIQPGLQYWLERMLTASPWVRAIESYSLDIYGRVMETCCLHPSEHTQRIADLVLEHCDEECSERWQSIYASVFAGGDAMDEDTAETVPEMEVDSTNARSRDAEDQHGWRIDRGPWHTVPIGAVLS